MSAAGPPRLPRGDALVVLIQLALPVLVIAAIHALVDMSPIWQAALDVSVANFGLVAGRAFRRSFVRGGAASGGVGWSDAGAGLYRWEAHLDDLVTALYDRGLGDEALALTRLICAYRTHADPDPADVKTIAGIEEHLADDRVLHDLMILVVVLHDRAMAPSFPGAS